MSFATLGACLQHFTDLYEIPLVKLSTSIPEHLSFSQVQALSFSCTLCTASDLFFHLVRVDFFCLKQEGEGKSETETDSFRAHKPYILNNHLPTSSQV